MDDESRTFTLYGTREILETIDPPPVIEEIVDSLEKAVSSGSPIAFELAKSLIDSFCKTILNDRGVEISGDWDTPRLFRETITNLNFIPDSHPDPHGFHERMIITLRDYNKPYRVYVNCEIVMVLSLMVQMDIRRYYSLIRQNLQPGLLMLSFLLSTVRTRKPNQT